MAQGNCRLNPCPRQVLFVAAPAQAAAPPPGYPSYQVLGYGKSSGIWLPLRRGVYDSATGKGFGYDKTYWKHGIKSVASVTFVMNGPGEWEGTDWVTMAYASKVRCATYCYVEKSQPVKAVTSKAYTSSY